MSFAGYLKLKTMPEQMLMYHYLHITYPSQPI